MNAPVPEPGPSGDLARAALATASLALLVLATIGGLARLPLLTGGALHGPLAAVLGPLVSGHVALALAGLASALVLAASGRGGSWRLAPSALGLLAGVAVLVGADAWAAAIAALALVAWGAALGLDARRAGIVVTLLRALAALAGLGAADLAWQLAIAPAGGWVPANEALRPALAAAGVALAFAGAAQALALPAPVRAEASQRAAWAWGVAGALALGLEAMGIGAAETWRGVGAHALATGFVAVVVLGALRPRRTLASSQVPPFQARAALALQAGLALSLLGQALGLATVSALGGLGQLAALAWALVDGVVAAGVRR